MKNEMPRHHVLLIGSYAPVLLKFRGALIRDIHAAGHRISVCSPSISAEELTALEALGAEVHEIRMQRTGLNPIEDLLYGYALYRLMRQLRPSRVLTYTIKPNIWGAFAAAHAKVNSFAMVTGLGYAFTDNGASLTFKRRFLRGISTWLYAQATKSNVRVVFQNPDDLSDFVAHGCLKRQEKAALISGSGVDMVHYARVPLPSHPSFLMVARLLRSKGIQEYAEAAIRMRTRYPGVRFRLVGYFDEGPDTVTREEMDRWVALGLEYSGSMADIRPAMKEASVYVLPSYREGTPRSVLEAMAMGRPIITTDAPGCRETVREGENGFLVQPRDVESLTEAIERFISCPELIEPMGEKSWQIVRDRYEIGMVNRALSDIIEL